MSNKRRRRLLGPPCLLIQQCADRGDKPSPLARSRRAEQIHFSATPYFRPTDRGMRQSDRGANHARCVGGKYHENVP